MTRAVFRTTRVERVETPTLDASFLAFLLVVLYTGGGFWFSSIGFCTVPTGSDEVSSGCCGPDEEGVDLTATLV
ncbi:hypothetical protein, partial [Acinetobacter nosocomialis]|uniref:hypothetical protein n=1 Tax=Acinetobacter nosocomialis TaxID=106654 RepID=UPI001C089929